MSIIADVIHIGVKRFSERIIRPVAEKIGITKWIGWHTFRHTYSTLLRSVGAEFKVMQELMRSLVPSIHDRHLHPGSHAGKARCASRRVVLVFPG